MKSPKNRKLYPCNKATQMPKIKKVVLLGQVKRKLSNEPDPYQKKVFFETLPFSGFVALTKSGAQRFTGYKE